MTENKNKVEVKNSSSNLNIWDHYRLRLRGHIPIKQNGRE